MSSCNIVINQQQDVTKVVEVRKKHPGRIAQGHKLAELMRLRKLGLAPPKSEKFTVESLLEEFKRDLNDPAAILIAIEETIRIMKEDYKIELCFTMKKM